MKVGYFFLLSPSNIRLNIASIEARFTISRTWGFFEHAEVIASDTRLPRPPRNPTHVDVLSFPSSETAKNATPHLSEISPPRRVEHSFEFLGDLPDTGSEIDRLPGLVGFGFRRWADEVSGFVLDGIR